MMTRDELIEAMAREIDPAAWWWTTKSSTDDTDARKRSLWEAAAALRAIEARGLVIVPREATAREVMKGRFAFGNPGDCRACRERPDDDFAAAYRVMVERGRVK